MSVEILTIDLSEATIEAIAEAVTRRISGIGVGNASPNPQRTQRPEVSEGPADPWAEPGGSREARDATVRPTGAAPAATSSTPGPGPSAAAPRRNDEIKVVETKFGIQTWRFPDDAPNCDCGQKAGLMGATSKAGKPYKAWKCAKRSGDGWRSACDYSEFTR